MKINHVFKIVLLCAVVLLTSSCATTNYRIEWPVERLTGVPHKIALTHDGKMLAVGGLRAGINLYDTKTRATIHRLVDKTDPETSMNYQYERGIYALAFSADGQLLFSGDEASQLKIWSTQSGKLIKKINAKSGRINALAISRNGKQIASGTGEGWIKIWDIESGELQTELRQKPGRNGIRSAIKDLVYLHEANQLAALGWGINIWDVQTGKHLEKISWPYYYDSTDNLSLSTDGRYLSNGVVWDLQKQQIKFRPILPKEERESGARITKARFSPDGKFLVTSGEHGKIDIWDVNSGKIVKPWFRDKKILHITQFLLAPDNKTLITLRDGGSQSVYYWDLFTGEEIFPSSIPEFQPEKPLRIYFGGPGALSNDKKIIAMGSGIIDAAPLKLITTIPLTYKQRLNIRANAVSSDMRYYAACIKSSWDDGFTGIWNISSGKLIAQLNHYVAKDLVFSLDGKSFTFIDPDESVVYRVNSETGKIIWKINDYDLETSNRKPFARVKHLRLSNGGHELILVITNNSDGLSYISVRNYQDGKQVRVLKNANMKQVDAASLSNDDKIFAFSTSKNNQSIVIGLDINTGKQLFTIDDGRERTTALAFSPDRHDLATAGKNPIIHFWNLKSLSAKKEVRVGWITPYRPYVYQLEYSPDSKRLYIGGIAWDLVNSKRMDVIATPKPKKPSNVEDE